MALSQESYQKLIQIQEVYRSKDYNRETDLRFLQALVELHLPEIDAIIAPNLSKALFELGLDESNTDILALFKRADIPTEEIPYLRSVYCDLASIIFADVEDFLDEEEDQMHLI